MFNSLNKSLYNAKDLFIDVTPNPINILSTKYKKIAKIALKIIRYSKLSLKVIKKEKDIETIIGTIIGNKINGIITNKINIKVTKLMDICIVQPNESHLNNNRSWFIKNERLKLNIAYHESSLKHLDVHFSNGTSFIYRVSGKPVENKIKFNSKGMLTEESKKALINHIRSEIANKSRVPQNIDHNVNQSQIQWKLGKGPKGYGAGPIREVILSTEAQVMKTDNATTLYIPSINSNNMIYSYLLYPAIDKKAPIAIIGNKSSDSPKFIGSKLKLKLIQENDIQDKFINKIDPKTCTIKKDGCALYIHQSQSGTRLFSHRTSIKTGNLIEHTGKVPEIADLKGNFEGMCELIFLKNNKELTAAEIGGILNSNSLRPKNVSAKLYLYRADIINNEKVIDLDFFNNRKIQEEFAKSSNVFDVVPLSKDIKIDRNIEGYVGVPSGKGINEGLKLKFKGEDIFDWRIDKIDISYGPTSKPSNIKLAGKVHCTSTNSGRQFELGVNAIGNRETCLDYMNNPDKYIGKVLRVSCLQAHEGRSAKVDKNMPFHMDKGIN